MGYIYLLKVYPESNENIYKFGMTNRDFYERYSEYINSKHSPKIILVIECKNCDTVEKNILSLFNTNFKKSFIGNEYFIGEEYDMKKIIMNHMTTIKPDLEKMDIDYQAPVLSNSKILLYEFMKYLLEIIIEKNIFSKIEFSDIFSQWYQKQNSTYKVSYNFILNVLEKMNVIIITDIITVYDDNIQILLKKRDYQIEESIAEYTKDKMGLDYTSNGTSCKEIYDNYKSWCLIKNRSFLSYKKFDDELTKKYLRYKTNCIMYKFLVFKN